MNDVRQSFAAISELVPERPVRVLGLCNDQERVIAMSDLRSLLPSQIELVPGPGCAASVCPEADIYQAMQLVTRHGVTMIVSHNLLHQPLSQAHQGLASLYEMMQAGADIRPVDTPMDAVAAARKESDRDAVYFLAGFETLLAPMAGMAIEGLPENLSILLCGRRAEPLVEQMLAENAEDFDALLLPGNRCALSGTDDWDRLSAAFHKPAVVAGYSIANILSALRALLEQLNKDEARVENLYRLFGASGASKRVREHLERVFERGSSNWRGIGSIEDTGFQPWRSDICLGADERYPNYRNEFNDRGNQMPLGCECANVMMGRKRPVDCPQFAIRCTQEEPLGPCMASEDGTCYLHGN